MSINRNKLLCIIFYLSVMLMIIFQDSNFMPGSNTSTLFLVIPTIYSVSFISKYKVKMMQKSFLLFFAYLIFITLIHFQTNFDPQSSIFYFIEVLIIFVCCEQVVDKVNIDSFFLYLRNTMIILSFLGIIEGFSGTPFLANLLHKNISTFTNYRILSIFDHPIIAGVYFTIGWCLLLYYPIKKYYLNLFSHILLIGAIILTQSRSSWLAFLIVFVLICLKRLISLPKKMKIQKKKIIYFIVALTIAILLCIRFNFIDYIYIFIINRLSGTLYAGVGQGNIIRVDTVINSINFWKDGNLTKFIFGMGKYYDKIFMKNHPVVKWGIPWTSAIDNQYFATIHEVGIIGLLFLIIIFVSAIKRFFRKDNNHLDKTNDICNLVIVIIFVSNYFYEGLNYSVIVFMLILSIILSDKRIEKRNLM